jgi:predicted aldo/keto reductase-like oxidoreductase
MDQNDLDPGIIQKHLKEFNMKKVSVSRRNFIQKSSIAATSIAVGSTLVHSCTPDKSGSSDSTSESERKLSGKIPVRKFGKTGEDITILGYGGGSQFMKMPDGEWEPHLEHAIQSGINYFGTATSYGEKEDKPSETRYGEILPAHRDKILLLTKLHERDPDKAKAEFEASLKRLKTDQVDILLIHAIKPEDKLSDISEGIYKLFEQFKEEKMTRYIGFSSMDSAERSKELIENLDFDVTLLAMNPTNYGNFIDVALPAARKKNLGTIAMKVMRDIVNDYAGPQELLEYAWEKPGVHCAVVAMTGMDPLNQNLDIAMNYKEGNQVSQKMYDLERRLTPLAASDHLVYSRPGYYDGLMC